MYSLNGKIVFNHDHLLSEKIQSSHSGLAVLFKSIVHFKFGFSTPTLELRMSQYFMQVKNRQRYMPFAAKSFCTIFINNNRGAT